MIFFEKNSEIFLAKTRLFSQKSLLKKTNGLQREICLHFTKSILR